MVEAKKAPVSREAPRARRIGLNVPPAKVSDRHLLTLLTGSRERIERVLAIIQQYKPGSASDKDLTEAARWIKLVEEELAIPEIQIPR